MDNKSFDSKRIAEGYAKRPWLHQFVMEQIKKDCEVKHEFKNGLDVGCGAGLSTKALKLLCDKVTGTDISEEMIAVCRELYKDSAFSFYAAPAEETVKASEQYDIVTAAGVINWVDRERFLNNLQEVMAHGGLLIIYDFWITDKMVEYETYTEWYQKEYLLNFPKPLRKEDTWNQQDLGEDFVMKKQVTHQMSYEFDLKSFVDFMMIQSNVNAQIEEGKKTESEVREWMKQTLQPIFGENKRQLIFEGYNWYIEKI